MISRKLGHDSVVSPNSQLMDNSLPSSCLSLENIEISVMQELGINYLVRRNQ